MSTQPDVNWSEVDRLWRAVKRDYFWGVEFFAGVRSDDDARWQRLRRNWEALCTLNMDVASALAHGFGQMEGVIQKHGDPVGPFESNTRKLGEIVGVAEIGREANPDVKTETLGELYALGEEEIRRQLDHEFEEEGGDR